MRNLNIEYNTKGLRTIYMLEYAKKLKKYLFRIIWILKFATNASFLLKMTWYVFILILLRPLLIKATDSNENINKNVNIDERIRGIIFIKSFFINYPENIFFLYEYNIFLGNLEEDKKCHLDKFLNRLQKLIIILDKCFRKSKNSNIYYQYNKIKKLFDEFYISLSSLQLLSMAKSNNFTNEFFTPELFTSDPIKLKQYDYIQNFLKLQIHRSILESIKNFKTKYEKNEKNQEIYKYWIKPLCDAFEVLKFQPNDTLLSNNFTLFVYESLQLMREMFNSDKKTFLFKNNLEDFRFVRIGLLLEEIKEQKAIIYNFGFNKQKQDFIVKFYQIKFRNLFSRSYINVYSFDKNKNYKYAKIIKFLTRFFQKYIKTLSGVNRYINDYKKNFQEYQGKIKFINSIIWIVVTKIFKEYRNPQKTFTSLDYKIRNLYNNFLPIKKQSELLFSNYFYDYLADLYVLNLYLLKTTGCTKDVSSLFNNIQSKIAYEIKDLFEKKYDYVRNFK